MAKHVFVVFTNPVEGKESVKNGSVKNLGCYAASWIGWWPKRPSSSAALT
jgi:hypothetical protein